MIKRKLLVEEKKEKRDDGSLPTRKVKKKTDVGNLPDAVVDGKLVCGVGSELIVEKYRNGKNVHVLCTVKKVDDDGLVHTWDETIHQWYMWSLKDPPRVVKINLLK